MAIIFAADPNAHEQREPLVSALRAQVEDVVDLSDEADNYVTLTQEVCARMKAPEDIAVLVCGTGQGTSIVANKHKGVRAARCLTFGDAESAKHINDANVLCLSADVGIESNKKVIEAFLKTRYEGRKPERLAAIVAHEGEKFKD